MPIQEEGTSYFIIRSITTSCVAAGNGAITLNNVSTGPSTSLTVEIYRDSVLKGSRSFPANTAGADYSFTGLADGLYEIQAIPSDGFPKEYIRELKCGAPPPAPDDLQLSLAYKINPSANGLQDGSIQIFYETSNDPVKARINDGPLVTGAYLYENLGAGTYTFYVQDAAGFFRTLQVTLVDPVLVPVRGCMDPTATNYNPLAVEDDGSCVFPLPPAPVFYIPIVNSLRFVIPVITDNRYVFGGFDNTLYCQELMPGVYKPLYYQKVCQKDEFAVQFRCNFATMVATLHKHTGDEQVKDFVIETFTDPITVHEAYINLNDVPDGRYYVKIAVSDPVFTPLTAISEPFSLKEFHPNTTLLTYRHSRNKFDIVYSTNLEHVIRVESKFYKRQPVSSRSVYRSCNNELVKLASSHQRKFLLETFRLPPYLHEKLTLVLDHDHLYLNNLPYQTEEDYEFEYSDNYSLSNGSVKVEQVGWFGKYDPVVITDPTVVDGNTKIEFTDEEFN